MTRSVAGGNSTQTLKQQGQDVAAAAMQQAQTSKGHCLLYKKHY